MADKGAQRPPCVLPTRHQPARERPFQTGPRLSVSELRIRGCGNVQRGFPRREPAPDPLHGGAHYLSLLGHPHRRPAGLPWAVLEVCAEVAPDRAGGAPLCRALAGGVSGVHEVRAARAARGSPGPPHASLRLRSCEAPGVAEVGKGRAGLGGRRASSSYSRDLGNLASSGAGSVGHAETPNLQRRAPLETASNGGARWSVRQSA